MSPELTEITALGADVDDAQYRLDNARLNLMEACSRLLQSGAASMNEICEAAGMDGPELLLLLDLEKRPRAS